MAEFSISDAGITVRGKLNATQEQLRELGGKWDGKLQAWIFSTPPTLEGDAAQMVLLDQLNKLDTLQPPKAASRYSPSLGCVVPMTTWHEFEDEQ